MMKRIAVWFVETLSDVLLLGLVLTFLLGHDPHAFLKDLSIYSSGIMLLFFSTGYLLTTIVVRAIWTSRKVWSYPVIATVLFFIHFEIVNVGVGGAFEPPASLHVLVAGECIVLVCTIAGSFALGKWAPAPSKLAEPALNQTT